ncbi:dihydrofolate reductase, partial [Dysgonomonas sp. OttesenSCG-928-M03]|nr:dihydrofolate reductase [Dysgonomonas sp. OttesenSCG-928-M03]
MKKTVVMAMTGLSMMLSSCGGGSNTQTPAATSQSTDNFTYEVDAFADLQILRYQVPEFESLTLKQKEMIYYLSQAAIEGRDILFDQNNKYNLAIRRTLEAIYENYKGDKSDKDYQEFEVYLKRVWFSNGIHHHYGEEKFLPAFSVEFFEKQVKELPADKVPVKTGQSVDDFLAMIKPVMFDAKVMLKKVNQASGVDLIQTSANNYYGEGVTQKDVEAFYAKMKNPNDS